MFFYTKTNREFSRKFNVDEAVKSSLASLALSREINENPVTFLNRNFSHISWLERIYFTFPFDAFFISQKCRHYDNDIKTETEIITYFMLILS